MGSLTDVQIKQWIKAKEPVAKADGEGLTFTLSASGRAAWILRYRIAGKAKEKTLGQYPYISLAEARRLAAEDRAKIQLGVDVAVEKQRAKREAAGAWTVKRLAEDYLAKSEGRLEQSTLEGQKQRLRDYIYPVIGNVNACEVRPSDLIAIVERASKKSLHVARLVLGVEKAIFAHGFSPAVNSSNRLILSQLASEEVVHYRVDDPEMTLARLHSVVTGLCVSHNVVLLPLGPKIFSLVSLLERLILPEVSVWRVSEGCGIQPKDVAASGNVFGLRVSMP